MQLAFFNLIYIFLNEPLSSTGGLMNTIDLTAQSRQRREQYHSKDTYSSGYQRAIRKVREHCWYDVHPYSLAIWPSLYSDKVRTGKWWIQRQNYHGIAVELQIEGTTLYKTDSVNSTCSFCMCTPDDRYNLGNSCIKTE